MRRHDRGSAFGWLISVDVAELAFLVCDPRIFFPDYSPEIDERPLRAVGARSGEEVEILSIASVGEDRLSLNLCAPLLIHPGTRRGVQLILDRGDYPTRAEIALPRRGDSAGAARRGA